MLRADDLQGVINDTIVVKTHLSNATLFMFTDLQLMRQAQAQAAPFRY